MVHNEAWYKGCWCSGIPVASPLTFDPKHLHTPQTSLNGTRRRLFQASVPRLGWIWIQSPGNYSTGPRSRTAWPAICRPYFIWCNPHKCDYPEYLARPGCKQASLRSWWRTPSSKVWRSLGSPMRCLDPIRHLESDKEGCCYGYYTNVEQCCQKYLSTFGLEFWLCVH